MLLADNLFERSIHPVVRAFDADPRGAIVLLAQIPDAAHLRHLGVPEFGADGRIPDRREAGGASELLLDRRLLLRHVGLRRHQGT